MSKFERCKTSKINQTGCHLEHVTSMEIMPKSSVNMQSIEMKRDHNNVKSELCAIETEKLLKLLMKMTIFIWPTNKIQLALTSFLPFRPILF